jgi:predicted ATPase
VLSLIATQVRGWGGRTPVIIGVDDAHLLDDGSAAVLGHLANQRLAFLLVTVRTGVPCSDAVTALWKDSAAQRIELRPLSVGAVDLLLDHALVGQLEGFSRQLLHRTAAGCRPRASPAARTRCARWR